MLQIRRQWPAGVLETSPTGETIYRLSAIQSAGVKYDTVLFDFDEVEGMQMVFAIFTPASAPGVFEWLQTSLGPPSQCTSCGTSPESHVAQWMVGETPRVEFDGSRRQLIILGAKKGSLGAERDAKLLQQYFGLAGDPPAPN